MSRNFTESFDFIAAVGTYRAMYASNTPADTEQTLANHFTELSAKLSMDYNVALSEVVREVVHQALTPINKVEATVERDEARVVRERGRVRAFFARMVS